jgi:hypothetical protein
MKVNFKKGYWGHAFAMMILAVGLLFWGLGSFITWVVPPHSPLAILAKAFLVNNGHMTIVVGGLWTGLSFAGAFFEFDTRWLKERAFWAAAFLIIGVGFGIIIAVFAGVDMLQSPNATNLFFTVAMLGLCLLSSTFFLHAARMRDPEPRTAH